MRTIAQEGNEIVIAAMFIQVVGRTNAVTIGIKMRQYPVSYSPCKQCILQVEAVFPCGTAQNNTFALCNEEISYRCKVEERTCNDGVSILYHVQQAGAVGGSKYQGFPLHKAPRVF